MICFVFYLYVLALRKIDGTFILNGNWAINWSGEFDSLGTKFFYHREDEHTAESIASAGPLAEPLDLMVSVCSYVGKLHVTGDGICYD